MTSPIEVLKALGVDKATLERVARLMMKDPNAKALFKEQFQDKAFQESLEELYKEVNEVFDHDKSPKS